MSIAKAYGSITIVDISDLGTLSVYPESNSPTSIVYNPDRDKYDPEWTDDNPLQLNPVIYYGGQELVYPGSKNEISVKWFFKKGVNSSYTEITRVTSSTTVPYLSGAILKVPTSPFVKSDINDTNITYKCSVSYVEPNSEQTLTAEGQISFNLINQPASTKFCTITGESVFKYDSTKSLTGATSIELSARVVGCSVEKWQYKSGDGWLDIAGQTGTTLTVLPTDPYFDNNVANFKVVTNLEEVYDVHSITKLYDGAAGGEAFLATLSNEDSYVACDYYGNPVEGAFENIYTGYTVYFGDLDITTSSSLIVSATPQTGVTGYWTTKDDVKVYQINTLTASTGIVDFNFSYEYEVVENGETVKKKKTASRTMYLTKLRAGQDGVTPKIYRIHCPTAIKKDKDGNYNSITITAEEISGTTVAAYTGRYKILNGATELYSEQKDQTSFTYTPTKGLVATALTVQLYATGGFTQLLDTQTITVVSDGTDGQPGEAGAAGISFIFANSSEQIPCTSEGITVAARTITIPFAAYQGINRLACTAVINTSLPDGISINVNKAATTTADGEIQLLIGANKTLGGSDSGVIKVTLTAGTVSAPYSFSWSKNKKGANGANGASAVLLRVYSPTGNVINNGENSVTLSYSLLEGAADKTSSSNKRWYKFNSSSNSYIEITSDNTQGGHTISGNNLTVPAGAVESYASYRIDVTYPTTNGKTYTDYIVVLDKTDPIQVEIFSTLGDKITNGVGKGCIYARVYRNGKELDEIHNLTFSETNEKPSSSSINDVFVHIDSAKQEVNVWRRTATGWEVADFTDCVYTWKFADYYGNAINFNGASTQTTKFIYVDGSLIDRKTQFHLEVQTNNQ